MRSKKKIKLSLVIPCFNEIKNLPELIGACERLYSSEKNIEIIIVENGSTDGSAKKLKSFAEKIDWLKVVYIKKNIGYGHGVKAGLTVACGDVIGWTHADQQTKIEDALVGLKLFEQSDEEIFVKGIRKGRPVIDQIFSIGMSVFEYFLLGLWLKEINAQPTMFPKGFRDHILSGPDDFSIDLFAIFIAKSFGIKVRRFDVLFPARVHGVSSWNNGLLSKVKFIKRTIAYSVQLKKRF